MEELKPQSEYWSTSLIGYIIGDNPNEKAMENFVLHVWNFVTKPQILMHRDGYCVFRFKSVEDMNQVLQLGPYSFRNKPMILKPWDVDFSMQNGILSTIPIWVRFPGLPLGYWSPEILSKLASTIGRPLFTDKVTAQFEKISFARVLVEVDAAFPLPEEIEIETPFGLKIQDVEYDWKPEFCNHCLKFGHNAMDCWYNSHADGNHEQEAKVNLDRNKVRTKKPRQKWIPKGNNEATTYLDNVDGNVTVNPNLPMYPIPLAEEGNIVISTTAIADHNMDMRIPIGTDMAASIEAMDDQGRSENVATDGIMQEGVGERESSGTVDEGRRDQLQDPGPSLGKTSTL